MRKNWHILAPDSENVSKLVESLGCHPAVAAALVNRGLCTSEDAAVFLRPSFADARSPFSMKGINRAVERILLAIQGHEKMLIFGDYDADGVTATALLFEFFKHLGADVDYYIPDRLTEGYGLSRDHVVKQAVARGVNLIITVDCGTSSHDAVDEARRGGIDVIITDHHETSSRIPEAVTLLNPKQPHCPSGFSWLAGVGVAFNLALALRKRLREEGFWNQLAEPNLRAACDLVALGTIADMVPLVKENRIYVQAGLEVLTAHGRPGIKALLNVCDLLNRDLKTQDVAYKIAPRLNAAGRLLHASTAFRLLTTPDAETAYALAMELHQENARRQKMEQDILSEIGQHLEENPGLLQQRALVLDHHAWHQGIIGIVASRLVDRHHRPVVIITVTDGVAKGSARTPDGFNLYEGLKCCAQHLEKFGGHKKAAGLTLKPESIPAFRRDFERIVSQKTKPEDLVPPLVIDGEINPSDISGAFAHELEAFHPFGTGNPEPLFLLSDMEVLSARVVGNNHLQMRLRPHGGNRAPQFDAIYFNGPCEGQHFRHLAQIACHVRWNRWRGSEKIQLVVRDVNGAGESRKKIKKGGGF
jgi:single-stranded-DNA-specific exonuclease